MHTFCKYTWAYCWKIKCIAIRSFDIFRIKFVTLKKDRTRKNVSYLVFSKVLIFSSSLALSFVKLSTSSWSEDICSCCWVIVFSCSSTILRSWPKRFWALLDREFEVSMIFRLIKSKILHQHYLYINLICKLYSCTYFTTNLSNYITDRLTFIHTPNCTWNIKKKSWKFFIL